MVVAATLMAMEQFLVTRGKSGRWTLQGRPAFLIWTSEELAAPTKEAVLKRLKRLMEEAEDK